MPGNSSRFRGVVIGCVVGMVVALMFHHNDPCSIVKTTDSPYGVLDEGGVKLDYDGSRWSYVTPDGRKHVVGYSYTEDGTITKGVCK